MKYLANILTVIRIMIGLSMLFVSPFTAPFFVLYTIGGLTDMTDGFVARKTKTESALGAKLDSISDFVFAFVCMVKFLPVITLNTWIWIWIAGVAMIRVINALIGIIRSHKLIFLHTIPNKLTGLLLFVSVFFVPFIDPSLVAIPICAVATFASVQEGYLIFSGRQEDPKTQK
jgi:CDP-diacylglycerol--glycerol-3-phosphate 3-phosphatidyltransferase